MSCAARTRAKPSTTRATASKDAFCSRTLRTKWLKSSAAAKLDARLGFIVGTGSRRWGPVAQIGAKVMLVKLALTVDAVARIGR
jgi:hypothetical protein